MNTTRMISMKLTAFALALAAAGCATEPKPDFGTIRARQALNELEANPELASRAPQPIADARQAVADAENPSDARYAAHLAYLAEKKVQIAQNEATGALSEERYKQMVGSRDNGEFARAEAERNAQIAMLQDQLNGRMTNRGYVLTLGEVLFTTAKWDIKPGGAANLDKLVAFLTRYPDRKVIVEGHADNVGPEDYNQSLSQQRANSVRDYLVAHGVNPGQVTAVGRGESYPVAPNDNEGGRQQNRRIEIIIQNPELGDQKQQG